MINKRRVKNIISALAIAAILQGPFFGADMGFAAEGEGTDPQPQETTQNNGEENPDGQSGENPDGQSGENPDGQSGEEAGDNIIRGSLKSLTVKNTNKGMLLEWKKAKTANHYRVFRKEDSSTDEYKQVRKTSNNKIIAWIDTKGLTNGVKYKYLVVSCNAAKKGDVALPDENDENAVVVPRLKRKNIKAMTPSEKGANISWFVNGAASGYQIQFTTDPFFLYTETVTVNGSAQDTYSADLKASKKKRYARIRSFKKVGDVKHYSAWSYSPNYKKGVTLSLKYNKKGKKRIDYRSASKQKMWGYDTFQGACSNGIFSYNSLVNKSKDNAKIIKVNIASGKVVKVGKSKINGHMNSMTYNSDKNIIVTTGKGSKKLLNIVDPKKLKTIKVVKVSIPDTMCGITKAKAKKITGVTAVSYIPALKKYLVRIRGKNDFAIMNSSYVLERYVSVSKSKKKMNQSVFYSRSMYMNLQSPVSGSQYNTLSVYDITGTYITTITFKNKNEVEDVYTYRNRIYGQIYRSYMKPVKEKVKVKVKEKGKVKKTITKEVVKRYVFRRGSHIFRAY